MQLAIQTANPARISSRSRCTATHAPYPMSTVLAADLGGQSVFWMDDPANATTIGPKGWLFGSILTADWVAFLLDDNGTCDGGVDTTAGEGAAAPDVSMFTSHPETTFGTTSTVLNRLGEHAPPNLVAEGICDIWHPETAVQQWLGDPVFERPAFVQMVAESELFLGHCDQLRLAVVDDGVQLRNVLPQTLAAELGFVNDDIIVGMNGVAATDPVALMVEVMALSQTGGTAEVKYLRLDDHAGLVKEYASSVGVGARHDRYRYYWVDDETWAGNSPCPAEAGGCIYPDRDAYAADELLIHEIAHATLPGQTQSFFEEGLAEVLGDARGGVLLQSEPKILSIESSIDETRGETLHFDSYTGAGFFTRLLLDLYPEEALAAMESTNFDEGYGEIRSRLSRYEIDLDGAIEIYDQMEPCRLDGIRIALSECATEPTPWETAPWEVELSWSASGALTCDDPTVFGPKNDEVFTIRSVDIPRVGEYIVWVECLDFDTHARFVACDRELCEDVSENFGQPSHALFPGTWASLELSPGRYWFRIARALEDGPDPMFTVNIREGWENVPARD